MGVGNLLSCADLQACSLLMTWSPALVDTMLQVFAAILRLSLSLGQLDDNVQLEAVQAPLEDGCSDNTVAQLCRAILQQPSVALFLRLSTCCCA